MATIDDFEERKHEQVSGECCEDCIRGPQLPDVPLVAAPCLDCRLGLGGESAPSYYQATHPPVAPSPYPHGMTREQWRETLAESRFVLGFGVKEAHDEADAFLAEGDRRRAEEAAP